MSVSVNLFKRCCYIARVQSTWLCQTMTSTTTFDEKCSWVKPEGTPPTKLRLYNSLTRSKVHTLIIDFRSNHKICIG